jgi:outer membrane protein OmpA-like peptidoglycan-associated protein
MLNMKWTALIILILGAMIVSGCAISKDAMLAYNDAKATFDKATQAGAKKCAPCEYATAEAALALAEEEVGERSSEDHSGHFAMGVRIAKGKSLEALSKTPCEPAAPPPPPPPPAPAPAPPEAPAPPPPPPPPAPPAPAPAPPKVALPEFEPIYFDSNKTNINPAAAKALDNDGALLRDNPNVRVEIGGHTDSGGSAKANMAISEKRAQSVKKYLQDKFNIAGDRMTVKGYGETRPIAEDNTSEGRVKNRRVEIRILP